MNPIYLDLHIHTSEDPNNLNSDYNVELLVEKIKEFANTSDILISITDHNTINKTAYLKAKSLGINILAGAELHIKNYQSCPPYHCHIFFNIENINEDCLKDLNDKLDELYPDKVVTKDSENTPTIETIINTFDSYEFI